jgi:phage-related protein
MIEAFKLVGQIALDGGEEVAKKLDKVSDNTEQLGKAMDKTGEAVKKAGSKMSKGMDQASEAFEGTTEAIKDTGKATKKTSERFEDLGDFIDDFGERGRNEFGGVGKRIGAVTERTKELLRELQGVKRQQDRANMALKEQAIETELAWWKLTKSAKDYKGNTRGLIAEINKLGQADKKVKDAMAKNNELGKMGILEQVGAMSALTKQSDRVAKNYDRMKNPIYGVNKGFLAITASLEGLAKAGAPASLALRQLGAGANFKDIQDHIKLITAGLMRFQMVAIASGVALAGFTAILVKASMGEAPSKIREQMAEIEDIYDKALDERKKFLYEWAGLFENVDIKVPSSQSLIDSLTEQNNILAQWMGNIRVLTKRGVDEGFIAELREMGPKASGEIQAMVNMTDAQLDKYVLQWREKHLLINEQATGELQSLREATQNQIQKLRESIKPLAKSAEEFKAVWSEALGPFVELWGQIASKVVDFGTSIGKAVNKLNDVSPIFTQIAGMVLYLFTALTFILSPLAIGIGLVGGFAGAWALASPIIMPLIAGLASMAGTILLVIGAIILIIGIIKLMVDAFKEWNDRTGEFTEAWNKALPMIKSAVDRFITPIKDLFSQVMDFIRAKVGNVLDQLVQFWEENGTQIITAVQNFLNILVSIWNFVFPVIAFIVQAVIGSIIGIFQGFVNIVLGLVKIFTAIFTADWALLWEGLKQVIWGAIQVIWNWINLTFIGRILKGIGAFFVSMKALFTSGFTSLRLNVMYFVEGVQKWISNLVNLFKSSFTLMKNTGLSIWTSFRGAIQVILEAIRTKALDIATKIYLGMTGKFNSLLSTAKTVFNNIKTAILKPIESAKQGVSKAIEKIKSLFSGLKLQLPKIKVPTFSIANWSLNPADWIKNRPRVKISWNAQGGVVDRATLIGAGEAGKEGIVPLEGKHMFPMAEAVAQYLQNAQGGLNGRIEVPLYLDGREIARAIAPNVDQALGNISRRSSRARGLSS